MAYGKRKTVAQPSQQVAEEMSAFLNDTKSAPLAEGLEVAKLFFALVLKLLNPFNWKRLVISLRVLWLQKNEQYEQLLHLWQQNKPNHQAGEVFRLLQMTDCYIQLGRFTEAMACLKGLSFKIDESDRDDEWKKENHHKANLYRKTIQSLAALSYRKF